MDWNDETVEKLKKLWADGLSYTLIGARLGCSRSAVIGKVQRLKLAARRTKERKSRVRAAPALPVSPLNLTIFELTKEQCRYPYGDRAPYLFCGHPVQDGSSYCPEHKVLCEIRYERPPETKTYIPARGRAA